ncbi:hypothetical protein ACN20G_28050 (plasmid) [Streptomyces sp. BI20]|uniref:hypothetical protein n=1 Tax=Streptomyces sp. BI20 TaxID=3403460 RepID=UPI003C72F77F
MLMTPTEYAAHKATELARIEIAMVAARTAGQAARAAGDFRAECAADGELSRLYQLRRNLTDVAQ